MSLQHATPAASPGLGCTPAAPSSAAAGACPTADSGHASAAAWQSRAAAAGSGMHTGAAGALHEACQQDCHAGQQGRGRGAPAAAPAASVGHGTSAAPGPASAVVQLSPLEQLQLLKQREEEERRARMCSSRGSRGRGRAARQLSYQSPQPANSCQQQSASPGPGPKPGASPLLESQYAVPEAQQGRHQYQLPVVVKRSSSPAGAPAGSLDMGYLTVASKAEMVPQAGGGVAEPKSQPAALLKLQQLMASSAAAAERGAQRGSTGHAAAPCRPGSGVAALRMLQAVSMSDLQRACPATAEVLLQRCASGRPELLEQVLSALLR